MIFNKIKWGIIGLGGIAHHFAKDLLLVDDANLYAVASRSIEKANEFGNQYGAEKCYGSYEALLNDSEVDIVYIATPHNSHLKLSIQAIEHGKHILCEKPVGVNQFQAKEVTSLAKTHGVFFMEALWSRFNPSILKTLSLIKEGAIGKVSYINADFSFNALKGGKKRLFDINLAGGALLDIGIYPLFLSYMVFGIPEALEATAHFSDQGADMQTSMSLKYNEGIANLYCGFTANSDMVAKIYGSEGAIYISSRWHEAQGLTLIKNEETTVYDLPTTGKGYYYEILECHSCLKNKKTESDLWSYKHSVALMGIIDRVKNKIGLHYPFE